MKCVSIFDSFKGCISSHEIINSLELENNTGFALADGGEGTLDVIYEKMNYDYHMIETFDLNHDRINTVYLSDGTNAYIEAAKVIGLTKKRKSIDKVSSFGIGIVISKLIKKGYKKIHIGCGGTGTSDGGLGALIAMGLNVYNEEHELIGSENICNPMLQFEYIDFTTLPFVDDVEIILLSDVTNIFTGENGTNSVFAQQKGADNEMIMKLENKFCQFNSLLINKDLNKLSSSGSAGGLIGGLSLVFNSKIISGIEFLLDDDRIHEAIRESDIIICGEGTFDSQSLEGKLVSGVNEIAKKYHKKIVVVAGQIDINTNFSNTNIIAAFSIQNEVVSLKDALQQEYTIKNLNFTIKQIVSLI